MLQAAGALALSPACSKRSEHDGRPAKHPNILWIISDQHRADVAGFAGDALARTPHLDALAAQAARISDVYCQSPLCAPARQSILSGRYPHDHGCFRNRQANPIGQPTFVRALGAAGYRTALFGKRHCNTADFETVRGFHDQLADFLAEHPDGIEPGARSYHRQRIPGEGSYIGPMNPGLSSAGEGDVFFMEEHVTREALSWIDGDDPRPFFLWASYENPHPPLYPPAQFLDAFRDVDIPSLAPDHAEELFPDLALRRVSQGLNKISPGELANVRRAYYAALAWTDHCIGELLDGLQRRALDQDTLVVYTSDHGELLGQHELLQKRTLFEAALRVPCLVSWPGRIAPALHRRVAGHVDLTRTLFDLIGVEAPPDLAGSSLRAVLEGDAGAAWEDRALAELVLGHVTRSVPEQPRDEHAPPPGFGWMLRRGRWKVVQHNPGWAALYDIEDDPGELHDLLRAERVDPAHVARAAELRAELARSTPASWRYLRSGEFTLNDYDADFDEWEEDE